jgi:hypothetical protein
VYFDLNLKLHIICYVHVLFASVIWSAVSDAVNAVISSDYESITRLRIAPNNIYGHVNMISSDTLWRIWTYRNENGFQSRVWNTARVLDLCSS